LLASPESEENPKTPNSKKGIEGRSKYKDKKDG